MDELSLQSDTNPLSRHDFYLAMAASHFRHASERVRADFDDRFRSYWQKYLQDIASGYGDERKGKEMADLFKQHEKFRIRTLMRETMDILGTRSDAEDLPRIRRALDEEAVDPRISDIKFLERWGAFEDILRIDKILRDHRFGLGLGAILDRTVDFSVGARAVLRLAGERFVEIFSLDISASLLSEILKSTSLAKLKNLPSQVIDDLMTNQAEEVRKVSALQILRSVTNKKAKQVLSAYIEPGKHRFYNVVLWLDLAESYEVAEYRSVARRELERMR